MRYWMVGVFRPYFGRTSMIGWMTLDSGLRWNDVPGIMLCPDIFEHRLLEGLGGSPYPVVYQFFEGRVRRD